MQISRHQQNEAEQMNSNLSSNKYYTILYFEPVHQQVRIALDEI